jgi:NitT/TauT family transport system ATP-binding protein
MNRAGIMKLNIQGISKTFLARKNRVLALEDISLDVKQGEFVCLIGPSGCGKSTLLNIIAGLMHPEQGTVLMDGHPVTEPGPDRVVMFQDHALFPWLTVLGNVEFGMKMKGVPRDKRRALALEFLRMVHLSSFQHAYTHELSGGMKQRVALARALAINPDILLMDEPFCSLDAQSREILQAELQEIWSLTRKTIVFVTHNVREAVYLGNRVIVMSARPGRIKKDITIDLPRPRKAGSLEMIRVTNSIMQELRGEIETVLKEELHDA